MKIIFLSFALISFVSLAASGQDSNIVTMKSDTTGKLNPKDYLGLRGRMMMVYKQGDSIAMTSVITLNDGTVVKQDGSYQRKNGKTGNLKDGDFIFMDGTIRSNPVQRYNKDSTGNRRSLMK